MELKVAVNFGVPNWGPSLFDASMVDRCSRKWQCSSPENQIACHISIYFSWYSVSQILQMQARPNPSILSVFLEVWVTLWPERILGHSAACSTDFSDVGSQTHPFIKGNGTAYGSAWFYDILCQVYGWEESLIQTRSVLAHFQDISTYVAYLILVESISFLCLTLISSGPCVSPETRMIPNPPKQGSNLPCLGCLFNLFMTFMISRLFCDLKPWTRKVALNGLQVVFSCWRSWAGSPTGVHQAVSIRWPTPWGSDFGVRKTSENHHVWPPSLAILEYETLMKLRSFGRNSPRLPSTNEFRSAAEINTGDMPNFCWKNRAPFLRPVQGDGDDAFVGFPRTWDLCSKDGSIFGMSKDNENSLLHIALNENQTKLIYSFKWACLKLECM